MKIAEIIIYNIIISIISYISFRIDKRRAERNEYRISENFLLLITFFGGSIGSIIAMRRYRHKTKKMKFTIITFISLVINILFYYYLCVRFLNLK